MLYLFLYDDVEAARRRVRSALRELAATAYDRGTARTGYRLIRPVSRLPRYCINFSDICFHDTYERTTFESLACMGTTLIRPQLTFLKHAS